MKRIDYEIFIAENFGNIRYKGYNYLVDACILYDNKKSLTEIYDLIAEKYGVSGFCVERCIRYYMKKIDNYKGLKYLGSNFTPGSLINAIQLVLKIEKERYGVK